MTAVLHDPKFATAVTLVPNLRVLHDRMARTMQNENAQVLVGRAVFVLSGWAEQQVVRHLMRNGERLPRSHSRAFQVSEWETVVARLPPEIDGAAPFSAAERRIFARQARSADRTLRQWQPEGSPAEFPGSAWHALQRWRRAVVAERKRHLRYTDEDWMEHLTELLVSGELPEDSLPRTIVLDGFREHTTLGRKLLDALLHRGVQFEAAETSGPGSCSLQAAPDPVSEWLAAARWAREAASAGSRVGVAINELEANEASVRNAFDAVFHPAERLAFSYAEACDYHLSVGAPLDTFESIGDLYLMLDIGLSGTRRAWPCQAISRWLLSPWWRGSDQERSARAKLEMVLRKRGRSQVSLAAVMSLAAQSGLAEQLPALQDVVKGISSGFDAGMSLASRAHALITVFGWPGPACHGAENQQVGAALMKVLEQWDDVPDTGISEGLTMLRALCRDTPVVTRGGPFSPVQVVTLEDAACAEFDALWVANLTADNWPARPQYNPFIPSEFRDQLPRTSEEWMLKDAEQLTTELRSRAPQVCFSWSLADGEVSQSPSQLLADLVPDASQLAEPPRFVGNVWPQVTDGLANGEHRWLVPMEDGRAEPPTGLEALPGGSNTLALQAASPFAAFARYRLKALMEDFPTPFPDAATRGALVHSALEALYRPHVGMSTLPNESDIAEAVDAALVEHRLESQWPAAVVSAERLRLAELAARWLEFDIPRGSHVVEVEKRLQPEFSGLSLRVQLDRIEQVAGGRQVVLDYKTGGAPAQKHWLGDRILEPQVPLYAVALWRDLDQRELLAGAGIAQVKRADCKVQGRAVDGAAGLKAVSTDQWQDLLRAWDSGIEYLAGEIQKGICDNTLYHEPALKYSGLELLLRIPEGRAWRVGHDPAG